MIDDPPGKRNWWTAEYLDDLPDEAVDAFCDASGAMPIGLSQSLLVPWGGAVARVGEADTPMAQPRRRLGRPPVRRLGGAGARRRAHGLGARRARRFAPWSTGGVYLNFIGDEGEERIRAAFGEADLRAARRGQARVRPRQPVSGNQNVRPVRAPAVRLS